MAPGHPFELESSDIYCLACAKVTRHSRATETFYFSGTARYASAKILCDCMDCRHKTVLSGNDFAGEQPTENEKEMPTFKILGLSHLTVNDGIYFPETRDKGAVVSRFRSGNRETFGVKLESGREVELSLTRTSPSPSLSQYGPHSGFKLISDAAQGKGRIENPVLRIEDPVFHTGLKMAGKVVGISRFPTPQAYLSMSDGKIHPMTLDNLVEPRNDAHVYQSLKNELARKKPFGVTELEFAIQEGVATLKGRSCLLAHAYRLSDRIGKLPGVLLTLNEITIEPSVAVSDAQLHSHLIASLAGYFSPQLIDLKVEVKMGQVRIWSRIRNPDASRALERRLAGIPGIRSLILSLTPCPVPEPEDLEREAIVQDALERHTQMPQAIIMAYCLNGTIRLEGCVTSVVQRNTATLTAMWASKNLKVANNLFVLGEFEDGFGSFWDKSRMRMRSW